MATSMWKASARSLRGPGAPAVGHGDTDDGPEEDGVGARATPAERPRPGEADRTRSADAASGTGRRAGAGQAVAIPVVPASPSAPGCEAGTAVATAMGIR